MVDADSCNPTTSQLIDFRALCSYAITRNVSSVRASCVVLPSVIWPRLSVCLTGKTLVGVGDASNACAIEIDVVARSQVELECENLSCALEIVANHWSFVGWDELPLPQPHCHVDALHGTFCVACRPRPSVSLCRTMEELATHVLAQAYLQQSAAYHRFDLRVMILETNTKTIHYLAVSVRAFHCLTQCQSRWVSLVYDTVNDLN